MIRGQDYSDGVVSEGDLYHVSPRLAATFDRASVRAGDILMSIVGYVGTVAEVPTDLSGANLTQTTARISLRPGFRGRYFLHFMRSEQFREEVKKYTKGSAQPGLNLADVEKMQVCFPRPELERNTIAQVLDTLGTVIQHTEAIVAKLRAVKQGLLHDLLTRGIDASGELRPSQSEAPHLYKQSALGWIPKEWRAETLGSCSLKIADRDHTTPQYVEEGVLIVSPTNLLGEEGIDFAGAKRISLKAHETNRKKTDLAPGDIILHRIGAGLGRVRLVKPDMPEFSILHSMAQVRPNLSAMTSEFMLWAMRAESTKSQMGLGTQSIGVPDLGLDKISNFIVVKPPLQEQKLVASRLDALQERIDLDTRDLGKMTTLKSGLMDDLLTGRVRVTPLLEQAEP